MIAFSRYFWAVLLSFVLFLSSSAFALDTVYTLTENGSESIAKGKELFDSGRYDEASPYFWRAVLMQSQHADEYTVEDAFGGFIQCYSMQGRTADGFVYIAKESLQRGQKEMAQKYVDQALALDPTHQVALKTQARLTGEVHGSAGNDAKKFKPRSNKFQASFGTDEAENPLDGKGPEDLYEYGSTLFSRRNYEHCADVFELSCERSNYQLGPACSNAVYCRMMVMDWGFNGTGFENDMKRLEEMTEMETERFRGTDDAGDFYWHRATSIHPHMMLGYPLPPLQKRYVTESVAYMDEAMARVAENGALNPLPADMPYVHDYTQYVKEAAQSGFKLKVGFISSGFNSKAVLYLSQDIFRFYDRSKIEMHVFSLGPPDNDNFINIGMRGVDWRKRVQGHVDHFHDLQAIKMNHIGLAKFIKARGIHILIEWDGYARQGERAQGLMALRPAPVQILHQEYLGTSGAKYVDYIFTDPVTSPMHLEYLYTEKFIYLPNHFFSKGHAVQQEVHPPTYKYTPVAARYEPGTGSPEENKCMAKGNVRKPKFVFCNFNKFLKNNPETLRSWMRILREVPGSILCLLENPPSGAAYLKRFVHEAAGKPKIFIDPRTQRELPDFVPQDGDALVKRIHFLPWERNPFDHQRRNQDFCHVMLDSYPYNGHTVAQDALYGGVPIVTRSDGEDMSSRVTTSSNIVLGLEGLNAYKGPTQYEDIAIELGTNRTYFNEIRNKLISTALKRNPMHPYWDAPRYARNLETGLFQAWDRFLSGQSPNHIRVVESHETAMGTYDEVLEAHPSDPVVKKEAHVEL